MDKPIKNDKLRPLNRRQQMFCEEYLIDLNATQAAIRAGYSSKCANEIGARLCAHVSIRAYIDKKLAERSKRTGINADRVLAEMAKLALVNPLDVFDMDHGCLKDDASRDDTAAIQSVKYREFPTKDGGVGIEREIRFNDKAKVLDMLAKHLRFYEHNTGGDTGGDGLKSLADVLDRSAKKHGLG